MATRRSHPQRGRRVIDGREYLMAGRATGWDARERAEHEARAQRRSGALVRIIALDRIGFDYAIYRHG